MNIIALNLQALAVVLILRT